MADIIKLNPEDEQALEEGLHFCAASQCYGLVYLVNEEGEVFYRNIGDFLQPGDIMQVGVEMLLGIYDDEDTH